MWNPWGTLRGVGKEDTEVGRDWKEKFMKVERKKKTGVWGSPPRPSINGKLRLDVGNTGLDLPGPWDPVYGSF